MGLLKMVFPFLKNRKPKKEEQRKEKVFDSLLLLQGRKVSLFQGRKGLCVVPRPLTYQEECYVMGRVNKQEGFIELKSIHMDPPIKRQVLLNEISEVTEQ